MSRPVHVQDFIDRLLPIAREVRKTYGVPISVCLAQGGLESGWNSSGRSVFGIATKGDPSKGFVEYDSLLDAAMAYGKNLRYHRAYANAWIFQNDPLEFVNAIGDKYAPDQNYAQKIKSVIGSFHLTEYDDAGMFFSPSGVSPGVCK